MFKRNKARFLAVFARGASGKPGISVALVGTKSACEAGQPDGGGWSGAGRSLGWRGFRAHTTAPSATSSATTSAGEPRRGRDSLGDDGCGGFGSAEDIAVYMLDRNAGRDYFDGEREWDAGRGEAGVIVASLVGELPLQVVRARSNASGYLQLRQHGQTALVNGERLVGKLKLHRRPLGVGYICKPKLLAGVKLQLGGNQVVERRLVIVDVVAGSDGGHDRGLSGRTCVEGVG